MQLKPPSPTEALIEKFHQISLDDSLAIRHLNLIKYESIKICSKDRLQFLRDSVDWRIGQIYQKLSESTSRSPISIPPEIAIEMDCASIVASECSPIKILLRIQKIRDTALPCFKFSLAKQTPEECATLRSHLRLLLCSQLDTLYHKELKHPNEQESKSYIVLLGTLIEDIMKLI